MLEAGGEIPFAELLFWLQVYSADNPEKWLDLEIAMTALTRRLVKSEETETVNVEGEDWFLKAKPLPFNRDSVTIQRGFSLIAIVQP